MEIENSMTPAAVAELLIDEYERNISATAVHSDEFQKLAISRELKKRGYKIVWFYFDSDIDHYHVEIDSRA